MKTVLITGAAGDVGTHLRRELAGKYTLRLSDIKPVKKIAPGETSVRGDIGRLTDMLRVTKGVDAIVHLGGFAVEGPWDVILRANIYRSVQRLRGGASQRRKEAAVRNQQSRDGIL